MKFYYDKIIKLRLNNFKINKNNYNFKKKLKISDRNRTIRNASIKRSKYICFR